MPAVEQKQASKPDVKPEQPAQKKEHEFQDGDLVVVLHGYGRVSPTHKQYVDTVAFEGGIARNVPWTVAQHWKSGTRPDGKPVSSRVHIQAILPNNATEEDFARATGIKAGVTNEHMSALLGGLTPEKIAALLGPEKTRELATRLGVVTK